MVDYLVRQIKSGRLSYEEVIKKYPKYKTEIDEKLGIVEG